jgi:UPF0755 protein
MKKHYKKVIAAAVIIFFLVMAVFLSPKILEWEVQQKQIFPNETFQYFPVTVDPKNKTITENDQVNAFLADKHSLLGAVSASNIGRHLFDIFESIAIDISNASWYQNIASVSGRFVTIKPGMRKEQVAAVFGDALKWNSKERQVFITPGQASLLSPEGSFAPGLYSVSLGMTPEEVRTMIDERFSNDVLSHYGTSTQEIVPLDTTLIIASLIQRETVSTNGMRLISGIIWNRLFKGMILQIDSTLQYAKANGTSEKIWWPNITPDDRYIASPFNTYLHNGLPPTPISNPSVEAILAALNPVNTSCFYYFNDRTGAFHCSLTYAEHVSLIKKYYGN